MLSICVLILMTSSTGPPDAQGDDQRIVRIVLAGDADAFKALIDKYQDHVLRVVSGKVPRGEELEVGQDAFVRAFTSLKSYDLTRPFRHWLTGIAVRCCYDYWRARKLKHEVPHSGLSEAQQHWLENRGATAADGADEAEQMELRQLLDWALGHLSGQDRLALILIHIEGRSVAEAARMLGWSQANVKVRTFRARQKLRALIERNLPAEG